MNLSAQVGKISEFFGNSGISCKLAGRNKMCRLENLAEFKSFENLNQYWVDLNKDISRYGRLTHTDFR